jgi:ATP-dependent Zn protease
MKKLLLHKDDLEILDYIISECLKYHGVRSENLKPLLNGFLEDIKDIKESRYLRYFKIIKEYNIAEVTFNLDSSYVRPYDIETLRFYKDGGFRKLYDIQQTEIELTNHRQEKELNESILIKWHKKTYWWTFIVANLSFIVALLALYFSLKKN